MTVAACTGPSPLRRITAVARIAACRWILALLTALDAYWGSPLCLPTSFHLSFFLFNIPPPRFYTRVGLGLLVLHPVVSHACSLCLRIHTTGSIRILQFDLVPRSPSRRTYALMDVDDVTTIPSHRSPHTHHHSYVQPGQFSSPLTTPHNLPVNLFYTHGDDTCSVGLTARAHPPVLNPVVLRGTVGRTHLVCSVVHSRTGFSGR